MKKVLIISYNFPPCNMTPAFRTYSWAKYFTKYGYYPVVITRNWDIPILTQTDVDRITGEKVKHEKNESFETYYVPFKGNWRTKMYLRLQGTKFLFLTKMLTVLEIFIQNFFPSILPFSNLLDFTRDYVKHNKDIDFMIISANPYVLFKLGYEMKQKYGLKWVADYRDDWSTSEIKMHNNLLFKLKYWLDAYFEKKWVRTADVVTTVSGHYVQKLEKFLKKKCYLIENGYYEEPYENKKTLTLYTDFTIVFNGTLYKEQSIEIFLEAFKKIVVAYKGRVNVRIMFVGLAFDKVQTARVEKFLENYSANYIITPRLANSEVLDIQMQSHLLLMVAHKGLKGVPGSKLYEYIGSKKPVLICPPDRDIIQSTLSATGQAILANNANEAYDQLSSVIDAYLLHHRLDIPLNLEEVEKYTRSNQCKKLAGILDDHS